MTPACVIPRRCRRTGRTSWRVVVAVGVALGAATLALQLLRYRWLVLEHAVEMYATLVGVVFAAAGVWMGRQWRRSADGGAPVVPPSAPAADVGAPPHVVSGTPGPVHPAGTAAHSAGRPAGAAPRVVPFVPDPTQVAALGLTPRELEILALIAEGLATAEIAERAGVSVNTVKTHVTRVLRKLGAERRTQAVLHARTLGLVP